jgi:zinc protease
MEIRFCVASAALLVAAPAAAAPTLAHHVCPNGLEVVVAEQHSAPLVTVEIAAHNGAMTEPPEYNGLSHLYEHMFFKGNKVLPDQLAWLARSRELGLLWNGTTDNERVNYYFTTTRDHLTDTMIFMRDAMTSPLFDAKELERERVVVTGEIDRNESDPEHYLWLETEKRAYAKYPSRKNALGSRKTVLAATPAMMRTIQARYYVPNNSVLVVTGDVQAQDVFDRADALYASWKRAPDPFVAHPLVHHPPIARSEVVVVEQPVEAVRTRWTQRGPQTSDATIDDTYAGDTLGWLTWNPASRFQRALVDSGLCVRASMIYETQRNAGEITVDLESTEERTDRCVQALLAELPKLGAADYFTDGELQDAAHRAEISFAERRESSDEYAHALTFWWASASLDYYDTYVDRMKGVTRPDLARYLARYVVGRPFVFSAMVSPKMAAGALNKAHFEALVGVNGGAK